MHRRAAVLLALFFSAAGCLQARSEAPASTEAERLVALLELEPGDAVAEIGAGDGDLTVDVARALGPRSRVFTTELQGELAALRRHVADAPNVTAVEALADATNLPEGCCEAVYMRRVFHHFRRPERNAATSTGPFAPAGGSRSSTSSRSRTGNSPTELPIAAATACRRIGSSSK